MELGLRWTWLRLEEEDGLRMRFGAMEVLLDVAEEGSSDYHVKYDVSVSTLIHEGRMVFILIGRDPSLIRLQIQ